VTARIGRALLALQGACDRYGNTRGGGRLPAEEAGRSTPRKRPLTAFAKATSLAT
jgi:hypothetical protein